jgi:hypothetical protein
MMKRMLAIITMTTVILSACSNKEASQNGAFLKKDIEGTIEHIHGAGYPGNDKGVYLATHSGLKIYQNGKWYETTRNNHDYMGFQATKEGFYASGHPGEGSDLKNPLGLVQSLDKGKSLKKIGFYGESDFHYVAAGYENGAIYVVNEQPNSEMEQGLYYSLDKGETWKKSQLRNMPAVPANQITVHPTSPETVGVATLEGIYLSKDYGNTFTLISNKENVTSLSIQKDYLLYASVDGQKVKLIRQELSSKEKQDIKIPNISEDNSIMYISVNPKNEKEMTMVTIKNDIFLTLDGGQTWRPIAKKGRRVKE